MTRGRAAIRPMVAWVLLVLLSACAQPPGGSAAASTPASTGATTAARTDPAPGANDLVLRIEYTRGFLAPRDIAARLPLVSVYGDGRVVTQGPVPAIYPGPALPNLQVRRIGVEGVRALITRALAAGVATSGDLGLPTVADLPATRFTLVTAGTTHVRDVEALGETTTSAGSLLTADQIANRTRLQALLDSLADPGRGDAQQYAPTVVAVIARDWIDPRDHLAHPAVRWPGPALPGSPLAGFPEAHCVTASGGGAQVVLTEAAAASRTTPWTTPDGARWSILFRPLLPDETGCSDLAAR